MKPSWAWRVVLGMTVIVGIAWVAWHPLPVRGSVGASPLLDAGTPSTASTPDAASAPGAPKAFYAGHRPSVPQLTALGRRLFSERALSAHGDLACVTCHDPRYAYGPAPGTPEKRGFRAIPSARYQHRVPRFTLHLVEGEDGVDQGPAGGFMWDGRASTAHDQARLPLFSAEEMGNASPAELAAKVRGLPWAPELEAVFGKDLLGDDGATVDAVLHALEVFQQSPPDFAPYDSKFDAFLRHEATLSEPELRGLRLFEAPGKGNCASCHPSAVREGAFPAFTDFGFVALGVPQRPGDPPDHGLCGPLRTDLAGHHELCNTFRTPSLRNVALRDRFFHNGSFTRLDDVVRFYATRDAGGRWGDIDRTNINEDPPFGPKRALSEPEIADVVAFLGTLTDGYER